MMKQSPLRRPLLAAALLLAAPAATPAIADDGGDYRGDYTVAETGRHFDQLGYAVASIADGHGTIVFAPGTYHDCATQTGGWITYKAAKPGSVVLDGGICDGKAALVLRGHGAVIDGLVFRHMSVGDGNGAGVRVETGDVTIRNAMFLDSQEGILGGYPNNQKIVIDHSTFSGLGQCDQTPDCAHSIYLANKGQVTITRSRFERGRGGHYVKLRVPNVQITDNSFDDTQGTKTNYMIDLPEGATGLIARNTFVQGPNKENWSGMIVVAAEAKTYSSAGLRIEGNTATLAPGITKSPAFVADLSHQPLAIGENKLGPGIRRFEQR